MPNKRKTAAEKRQEQAEAFRLLKQSFLQDLSKLRSRRDAETFAFSPRSTDPARSLYSNLQVFLYHLSVPDGASGDELNLCIRLVETMALAGELKPGEDAPRVIDRLREAIAGRF